MSIALTAKMEALEKRVEEAEKRIAALAAENIRLAYRVAELENSQPSKPGQKPKDASCQ